MTSIGIRLWGQWELTRQWVRRKGVQPSNDLPKMLVDPLSVSSPPRLFGLSTHDMTIGSLRVV